MKLTPLPAVMLEPLVRAALLEDLGLAGDITTDAIVPPGLQIVTALVARQPGVVAGLELAALAFQLISPDIVVEVHKPDGGRLSAMEAIATVRGPAGAILTAERVALNFLSHLSGIATATASVADALAGSKTRVTCTRKTMPGLRAVEKYAVRAGGGSNHRFGLNGAILIKDNHVAIAGDVRTAIARVRAHIGHLVKVEVDTLEQLEAALSVGVDAVLLDNMAVPMLHRAVTMVASRAITEASGRITPATAPEIAATGVDLISIGWLTHSVAVLDIGLDHKN